MKNDPLTGILTGVLALSALVSVGFFYSHVKNTRELNNLNTQVFLINSRRAAVNALIGDVLEYSKRNPSVDPILEASNLKPKSAAPNASKPATK
jgi:hypothetical protein